jgi:hypothetical protein
MLIEQVVGVYDDVAVILPFSAALCDVFYQAFERVAFAYFFFVLPLNDMRSAPARDFGCTVRAVIGYHVDVDEILRVFLAAYRVDELADDGFLIPCADHHGVAPRLGMGEARIPLARGHEDKYKLISVT